MKRHIFLAIIVLILAQYSHASSQQAIRMRPADHLIVDLFSDFWIQAPEPMNLKTINRGIQISLLYDMPIGTSLFSLATGLGVISQNLYSDHHYQYKEDIFDFYPIQSDYTKNKLNLNYLNIPLEFRFRNETSAKALRIHGGVSGSYLINAHTKYAGTDELQQRDVKRKTHKLGQIEKLNLSVHARIAYRKVGVFCRYSLSGVFYDNEAASMTPVSVGFMVVLY